MPTLFLVASNVPLGYAGVNILPRVPIKYRGTITWSWGRITVGAEKNRQFFILQVLNFYQDIDEKTDILSYKMQSGNNIKAKC